MSRRPIEGKGKVNGTTNGNEELTPLLTGTTDPRKLHSNAEEDQGIPPALRSSDPSEVKSGGKYVGAKAWATRGLARTFSMDQLDIYGLPSLAILMSYFSVGVALELLSTPVAYYLIDDLGASSSVYTVWNILVTLPWSFKVGYGFLSDCLPIGGLKRKPYMLMGWIIHILMNSILALMGSPGVEWTIILSFISACGYLLSDVMTDAIVVERTQKESMKKMGNIQASGYIARYLGSALGAIGGAVLYNKDTWGWGLTISDLFLDKWSGAAVPRAAAHAVPRGGV